MREMKQTEAHTYLIHELSVGVLLQYGGVTAVDRHGVDDQVGEPRVKL